MRITVISGLSGAGKSVAMHALEDLGYFCIDNLPVNLLPALTAEIERAAHPAYEHAAVAIDARNPADSLQGVPAVIGELSEKRALNALVFLEASDESLIKRFSETRRKHPLTADTTSLSEAISKERTLLDPIRESADVRIDTSELNLHQLRELMVHRVHQRQRSKLSLLFESFGYKHGVPQDADLVFDARCLPNPYWLPDLRPLTGRDAEVADYLQSEPVADEMVAAIRSFLDTWIPRFEAENRSYLTVAVGCTGGRHRSVYVVEKLAEFFVARREAVLVRHRELR